MLKVYALLTILGASLFAQSSYVEVYEKSFFRGTYPQPVPVLFRAFPVYAGADSFRVFVPVEIKYNYLQFLYEKEVYTAGAELEISFRNKKDKSVKTEIWQTEAQANSFAETHARYRFHRSYAEVVLPAGEYDILFKYHDLHGQQRLTFKRNMALVLPESGYAAPPLFFDPQAMAKGAAPDMGDASAMEGYWFYNRDLGVALNCAVGDSNAAVAVRIALHREEGDSLLAAKTLSLQDAPDGKLTTVSFSKNLLHETRYRLEVTYQLPQDSIHQVVPFEVVWFDKPLSMWEYDLASAPLQHILDPQEFKELTRGNDREKRRKLDAFWKSQDPTAETPFNELQLEFYARVDSAITRFSTRKTLGWKTDPGKIYISLGAPDKIDDHSLDPIPEPYMRWIYFEADKQVIYTFRALDGRKQYVWTETEEKAM